MPRALGLCCAQVPAPRRGTPPAIIIPRAPAPRRRGAAVPTPLLPVGELHSDSTATQGSAERGELVSIPTESAAWNKAYARQIREKNVLSP